MQSKPLDNLKIGSIDVRNAFQYTLETYSEKRDTEWKYYGYKGEDGEDNGPILNTQDVEVNTPESFSKKVEKELIMSHSEEVKTCHWCHGSGIQTVYLVVVREAVMFRPTTHQQIAMIVDIKYVLDVVVVDDIHA
jgi:hypothetical protein